MFLKKWKNSTNSITYNSWRSMRNRCLHDNANSANYKAKGVKICAQWLNDFDKFVEDMGCRPQGTTLDRIDPEGDYTPENCRWATWREQENNKPNLTKIEHKGEVKTIGEWCYLLDLNDSEIARAYKRYSSYGALTFDDIFYAGNLLSKRVSERKNKCAVCGSEKSCKWRKFGSLCNNCYARAFRWSRKAGLNIERFPEWDKIIWAKSYNEKSHVK